MNKWVRKSAELAIGKFYLDRLMEIYPPDEITRGLSVEEKSHNLRELFARKRCKELVKELIRLKKLGFKFPIENPYISFLSHYEEAIDKNPKTLIKICESLWEMNYEKLKEMLESPKKASRRIGPMFRNWLRNNFKFADSWEFEQTDTVVFLEGGDKGLREYAKENLNCRLGELTKGLDFIAKVKNQYLIGTAKFITDFGGTQFNQFYEAIRLIKESKCPTSVIKVAVIDGVAWLGGKMKSFLFHLRKDEFSLSALLLNEFISEVLRSS